MQPAVPGSDPIAVDEHVMAAQLNISLGWLRRDRRNKKIIPFIRLNGAVRYDPEAVRAALRARQEGGSV
jgi:hypothetical protein